MKRHYKHCPIRSRVVLILKGIKRYLLLLTALLFVLPPFRAHASESGPSAMILYEPRTGTVLEALHPDEPMLIASTTKIMTALVVLERCTLHERVTVTPAQTRIEGSSASLIAGEVYSVEDLLYGLMLASGNDAACVLAEHTAGSIAEFARCMNEKAEKLGLQNTHFANPHGLNDPEHYSSARDLALLTAAAMENKVFCTIFSSRSYETHGVEYLNHNKLLDTCEGCLGGKTGYTRAAGRTLVSCAQRDGLRLICVTLNDDDDWDHHRQSYDRAFSAYQFLPLPAKGWQSVPVISGTAASVRLDCAAPGALLHRGANVETEIELPRYLFAPLAPRDAVGTVRILENGRMVCTAEIFTRCGVALDTRDELMPLKRFLRHWSERCSVRLIKAGPWV